jgi:hypothetical protein
LFDYIFYSKSVALANYYLQEKIKEEMLYQHFQVERNQKLATFQNLEKKYINFSPEEKKIYRDIL